MIMVRFSHLSEANQVEALRVFIAAGTESKASIASDRESSLSYEAFPSCATRPKSNAAGGVLTASKNGGYALI